MSPEPLTRTLADWVATTELADIPRETQQQVRRIILDYTTAALLGVNTHPASVVRRYLARTDHDRSATVFGSDIRLSPAGAAAANGTAAHALDLDDGYTPGGFHPSASVVSASLAVAEALDSEPGELLRAIALGYEVACRMAGASHPSQRVRGFHNTALVGVFGSAAAVAALHGLDGPTIANAFGLAASHAGGLLAFLDQGSDVKRYHPAKAARDGLVSAELAAEGLTAPTIVLEAPHGYFHAFTGGDFQPDLLVGELGSTWRMARAYHKPYPCCRHVHGAIDAALELREQHGIRPDAIDRVVVDTFAIAASHDRKDIESLLDAQMSLPYCVAAALVHGEVGMSQFDDEARRDPLLNQVMDRVEVRSDEALTADYPRTRPARVQIQVDGSERIAEVAQPYGEPDNPMSDADIEAKFRRLVTPQIGEERADRIVAAVWKLDDPAELFAALAG